MVVMIWCKKLWILLMLLLLVLKVVIKESERAKNKYRTLFEEKKTEYRKNRYQNMSEESKQKLKEYQKNIVKLIKADLIKKS